MRSHQLFVPHGMDLGFSGLLSMGVISFEIVGHQHEAWHVMYCRLIDYEYAGYNPVALDIANHWCEHMADYHSEPPDQLYPDRFPHEKAQSIFTGAYVRAVMALKKQKEESVGLP